MTVEQRLDQIEDEFETVKQLLMSAARYAESAHERIERLTERQERTQSQLEDLHTAQERTQAQLDNLNAAQERTQAQLDNLTAAQEQTQGQLNQLTERMERLSSRLDEFVFHVQRLLTQQATRLEIVEGQTERLEAVVRRLDRNYEAQQSQALEFQRTTNASLERMDRILDYLLRQQSNE